ncbi:glycosyltransferase family 39 protein [bacterium]|nr:glycosyltransferase family 39 protein [bacterium]MCP5461727.1 glycosyltransferase family 39 protein [bacterium]
MPNTIFCACSHAVQKLNNNAAVFCTNRFCAVLFVIIVAFFIYCIGIERESIWHDEWCTINVIEQPTFSAFMQELIRTENNPPLYYLLLRAWTLNGKYTSPVHIRLLSALFAAITVGLTFYFAGLISTNAAGWIAASIAATSPYMCWYAQEARNLSLSACMTLLCIITFYRFAVKPDSKIRLFEVALCMLLGIFSHYFIVFLIPAQLFLCWCFQEKTFFRKWVIILIPACLLFLLWIPCLKGQLDDFHTEWLGKPSLFFLWGMLRFFTGGLYYSSYPMLSLVAALLTGGFFLYGSIKALAEKSHTKETLYPLIFFIILLIIPLFISYFKPILFQGRRYLIYILPLFFIITAHGIYCMRTKCFRFIILSIVIGIQFYGDYQMVRFKQKRQWDSAAQAISKYSIPGDAVFSADYTNGSILSYYGIGCAELCVIPDMSVYETSLERYNRLWFVTFIQQCPYQTFFNRKYKKLREKTFYSHGGFVVRLILYDLRDSSHNLAH